ncbi:MAG: hypothetical protein AAF216_00450 [Pseudomonadota bacterium]
MTVTPSKAELEYLHDITASGYEDPFLGGRFLAWWGALITLAYLMHYWLLRDPFGFGGSAIGVMWLITMLVGLGGYLLLLSNTPEKPAYGSAGNRAEPVLWSTAGFAIFALFGGIFLKLFMDGETLHPDAALPVVFAVYAVGLATTGALARNKILTMAGYFSLGAVLLTTLLYGEQELYLAGAASVMVTTFVPGLLLMRTDPEPTA